MFCYGNVGVWVWFISSDGPKRFSCSFWFLYVYITGLLLVCIKVCVLMSWWKIVTSVEMLMAHKWCKSLEIKSGQRGPSKGRVDLIGEKETPAIDLHFVSKLKHFWRAKLGERIRSPKRIVKIWSWLCFSLHPWMVLQLIPEIFTDFELSGKTNS